MSPTLKRKTSPSLGTEEEPAKRRFAEADGIVAQEEEEDLAVPIRAPSASANHTASQLSSDDSAASLPSDRAARFAALRARNATSRTANLKETQAEHTRQSTDTTLLTKLSRKRDIAAQKLLKADSEAAGEDFERKRAWDWTIEESEKWDKRMAKKSKARDNVAFQDFRQDANKVYKRQVKDLAPDKDAYEASKAEMIQRAAAGGGLEIVETEQGELIAVDKDGSWYSTADNTDFVGQRPSKEAVDRLVGEIKTAEEVRNKKRRDRGQKDSDEGDVTYINEKNKQFNQKLARFYNRYTTEIRESFERGTAI